MLKAIFTLAAALVGAFLVYVAFLPSTGVVTRAASIPAPPSAIFPHINDLHKWQDWSPWAKLDPNAKSTFEGPQAGVGAAMAWDGNHDVGTGKMTIIESRPDQAVKLRLDFVSPMQSTSTADFILQPDGPQTTVTWTMTGERPYLARLMCTLFQADKMVGEMFEKGLSNLSAVASKAP